MKHLILFVIGAAMFVGYGGLATEPRGAFAAPHGALLAANTHVTYDVRLDGGPARVTWQVDLTDNDPQTVYRDFGYIYSYVSYFLPILRGASAISALGPGGTPLSVTIEDRGAGPIVGGQIHFDRNLYYGQQYSFSLSYELTSARSENILVLPSYVFLPAATVGDAARVTVLTPSDRSYEATVEHVDCLESGDSEYQCSATDAIKVAALIEVVQPDATRSLDGTVGVDAGPVSFTVQHFIGEEAWAAHAREIVIAGLPVLEELFGVPYPGPKRFEITESGRREIYGYGGVFVCEYEPACHISLSPITQDQAILHELAHFWTQPFTRAWLREGLAEFFARRAGARLAGLVTVANISPEIPLTTVQLDQWTPAATLIGANSEQQLAVSGGYLRSLRLVESLERIVGLGTLQRVNEGAADGSIDSRHYLDLLEEVDGARLDDLFLQEVFASSYATQLRERREARDLFDFLDSAVSDVGLKLPEGIGAAIEDWHFAEAIERMEGSQSALVAYAHARELLDDDRSLWQGFGLGGSNPEAFMDRAASAFEAGDYEDALEDAEYAQSIVRHAGRAALYKLLVAAGLATTILSVLGTGLLLGRRRRTAR